MNVPALLTGLLAGELSLAGVGAPAAPASPSLSNHRPVPVIHVTDLFRPHTDPDDHWDLATQFALAARGDIDLRAVLIDYPPGNPPDRAPDIAAVAQLNRLTGLAVPVVVGSSQPFSAKEATDRRPPGPAGRQGSDLLLRLLAEAERPVVIHVVGSCRDVAQAGRRAPELFAQHCAGIYLNAGTGAPHPERSPRLEYNVSLSPASYAALFALPCPVYWMPCFEEVGSPDRRSVREFGSHYAFRQGDLLSVLPAPLQNYFLAMLERKTDLDWLACLRDQPAPARLAAFADQTRNMWCTAGFLHAAGWAVDAEGNLLPRDAAGDRAVCGFDPVRVQCSDKGVTRWQPDPASRDRFLFHVRDTTHYATALTRALRTLLTRTPLADPTK